MSAALRTQHDREPRPPHPSPTHLQCVSVLEAVGDQFAFGQVVQPGELAAAVSAAVEGRESLVAPLKLDGALKLEGTTAGCLSLLLNHRATSGTFQGDRRAERDWNKA